VAAIALASVAIFNYQKSSSPVIGATLYALRTSDRARAHLGDEIYFAQQIPWISGEMNQLHGRIDISFKVKGTKSGGVMKFASFRPSPRGMFETSEWSLVTDDGVVIDLLEEGDPFKVMTGAAALDAVEVPAVAAVEEDEAAAVARGFRKK
jgi:cytochrome c oxidase assembly factor 1